MRVKLRRGLLIALAILLALILILLILARPVESCALCTGQPGRPLVIAHQGGDGLWPGDTLFAFQQAAALGVDMLEMDMHSTADGVLVLMHDATVDRTTDGAGRIRDMTLAELKSLDAGYDWSPDNGQSQPFRGQGITVPTLEEVFDAFPGMPMNIEIKQTEPSIAEPFCQLIRQHDMADRVLVASFHDDAMAEFRAVCPEVATSASENEVLNFFVRYKLFLGATYSPATQSVQVPEYRSGFHILTPRFVRAAQRRGLAVHAWTINENDDLQRMIDLGLDGIISDRPDRLLELLDR